MARLMALLLMPVLSGCLVIGYPSATGTPLNNLSNSNVRAFKITSETGGTNGWVEELTAENSVIEPGQDTFFASSVEDVSASVRGRRNWKVVLYRPGYEVIEIPSRNWLEAKFHPANLKLKWKSATTTMARISAIDAICHDSNCNADENVRSFLAREYELFLDEDERPSKIRSLIESRVNDYRSRIRQDLCDCPEM